MIHEDARRRKISFLLLVFLRVPSWIMISLLFPSGIAWTPDGAGIFYDRLLPFSGGHGLYFHAVGTEQRQDRGVLYRAEHPDWFYQPHVSPNGCWLAVAILNGSAANRLSLFPLAAHGEIDSAHEIALVDRFTGRYDVIHWQEDRLILRAVTPDAPNGRLLALDLASGARTIILPESHLPLLDAAPLRGDWVGSHLLHGRAELIRYNAHGAPVGTIPLPGLGTVDWLATDPTSDMLHFAYTDFARPRQIYRWRVGDVVSQPLEDSDEIPFDPADFVTRSYVILSPERTPVPIFLAYHRENSLRDCPTLLTAYGGLGHTLTPRYAPDVLAWLELGGVYVSVCAWGGGEMGAAHHQAALGTHKQRTIACALVALHRATGSKHFLGGAARAWTFQQRLYAEPPGNWQDRRGQTPVFLHNWCNGAAGIGLAGAVCAADLHARPLPTERAALLLAAHPPSTLDTLCCGQFGQIESLLEMGRLQHRPDWIEQASVQARQQLTRTTAGGAFVLYDDLPSHLFNPGFFRGVAGIGYTLLRLAIVNGEATGTLPCVLRMAAVE
jgi:hypothetical protein